MKKIFLSLFVALAFTACSDKEGDGASAETSVKIDLEDEKESLQRNLEKAGREIEAGAKEAKKELKQAGETIQEEFAKAKDKLNDDDKAKVEIEVKKD